MSAVNLAASLPRVILMGRPNVGKSTLFNRLIRSRRAITHDRPGVTRDRMEGTVRGRGKVPFILVDTGGVTMDGHESAVEGPRGLRGFEEDILRQAKEAVAEGAVICLVVDGRDGLTPFDEHLAAHLRRTGKPVLLVVNKVDGIDVSFDGMFNTLVIRNQDENGAVAAVTSVLNQLRINVANMSLCRHKRGGDALMVIETDQHIKPHQVAFLSELTGILSVTYYDKEDDDDVSGFDEGNL